MPVAAGSGAQGDLVTRCPRQQSSWRSARLLPGQVTASWGRVVQALGLPRTDGWLKPRDTRAPSSGSAGIQVGDVPCLCRPGVAIERPTGAEAGRAHRMAAHGVGPAEVPEHGTVLRGTGQEQVAAWCEGDGG